MDQTASECGRKVREWVIEQIKATRPLDTAEVVIEATPDVDVEADGSVPPMPSMSGPNNDPTGLSWRFRHKVTVSVPDPALLPTPSG
jgi:hypothetical protein